MDTLAFGEFCYMLVFAGVIYYNMVIKRRDRFWLKIYLPVSVGGFLFLVIFGIIK